MRHVFICRNINTRNRSFLLLVEKDGGVLMSMSFYNCPNKKLSKKMINSLSYYSVGEYKEKVLSKSKILDYLIKELFPTGYDEIRIVQNYEVG